MKLSRELDYRIRYDVEHDLFHAQNIFNDEYIIKPTFIEYVQRLEKENAELKKKNLDTQDAVTMQMYTNKANKEIADRQLTKAIKHLKDLVYVVELGKNELATARIVAEAKEFLKETK